MSSGIELSIIIPVYNVQDYLTECLESAYKINGVNKEIIIVNDGSTDQSESIINHFFELYPNETIVKNQHNQGQSAARNAAIDLASGDYLLFLDSDDTFESDSIVTLLNHAQKHDLDLLQGRATYFGDVSASIMPMPKEVIDMPIVSGVSLLKKYCQVASIKAADFRPEVWLMLLKRDLFNVNNIKFNTGMYYEDELMVPTLFISAKKAKALDLPFYNYRIREGSTIRSVDETHVASKGRLVKEYYALLSNNKFYQPFLNNRLIGWCKESESYLSFNDLAPLFLLQKYKVKDFLLLSSLCFKSLLRFGKHKDIDKVLRKKWSL